jgi:hypothetical protein
MGLGQKMNFLLSIRLRESINDNFKDRIAEGDIKEVRP